MEIAVTSSSASCWNYPTLFWLTAVSLAEFLGNNVSAVLCNEPNSTYQRQLLRYSDLMSHSRVLLF